MKECKNCKKEKHLVDFYHYRNICKECLKFDYDRENKLVYNQKYYQRTRDKQIWEKKAHRINDTQKVRERDNIRYAKNKEKYRERRKNFYNNNKILLCEKQKIYEKAHRVERNEYTKNRIKTDPLFRLTKNIRSSFNQYLKVSGYRKKYKTEEILGCSFVEFKIYIESRFESWMNWDNKGLYNSEVNFGWDIDHIIPLSSAKTEGELIKLNHYSNLQPLCSKVNRDIKKANII